MLRPGGVRLGGIVNRRLEIATKDFGYAAQNLYSLTVTNFVSIAGGKLHLDSATISQLLGEYGGTACPD